MSRVGNRVLNIPEGVEVVVSDNIVTVTGKKGTLSFNFKKEISVEIKDNTIVVARANEIKHTKQLHGTTNAIINNMIIGVSEGYKKELEINGVGYRFNLAGNKLNISAGYSHPVAMEIPEDLTLECPSTTELVVSGIDKQKVTEFAAVVRDVRKPEPYKGKGIKYKDEIIRRKEGKKAA